MNPFTIPVFRPHEGAVVDLRSLEALADAPAELLGAAMTARLPGGRGLVLEGLELKGGLASAGPPGTVRPDPETPAAFLSPGAAVLTGRDGRLHPFQVREPLQVAWPDGTGPKVRGVLVVWAESVAAGTEDGVAVARDDVSIRVGFVRPDKADQPNLLPLAAAIGNGADWAIDLARVMQPEHPAVQALLGRFNRLDQSVWKAEPEGSVWERQVLGRSWVRYQTVASSALQSARMLLSVNATTTLERVRLLAALRGQLEQSVERVATELLQIVGPAEGAGPYRAVIGGSR